MKLNEPGRQKLRVPLWALGYISRKLRVPLWARGHTSRHWGFLSEGSSLSSKSHKQKLRVPLWALGHTSRNWGFPLWTVGLTNRKLRVPTWALGLTSRNWGFRSELSISQAETEGSSRLNALLNDFEKHTNHACKVAAANNLYWLNDSFVYI